MHKLSCTLSIIGSLSQVVGQATHRNFHQSKRTNKLRIEGEGIEEEKKAEEEKGFMCLGEGRRG